VEETGLDMAPERTYSNTIPPVLLVGHVLRDCRPITIKNSPPIALRSIDMLMIRVGPSSHIGCKVPRCGLAVVTIGSLEIIRRGVDIH